MFTNPTARTTQELLATHQIAYFCAEYGITDALPIYSGGLGVLAGDILQEAAAKKLPLIGIGLFYKLGYFHQHIDCSGQHEVTETINPLEVPLELITDAAGETLLVEVPVQERTVYAQVWRYPLEGNWLYLLDTDHWRNSEDDRRITDQLYGGDQAKRVQQELVLGIGGCRLLRALNLEPALYHMNEGHSAFLSLELLHRYLREPHSDGHARSYEEALAEAKKRLLFTNHTLVAAGNDLFPTELIRYYLGQYAYDSGIGIENILALGAADDQPDRFSMTMLALRTSAMSNAVSKLHGKKAMEVWPAFHFVSITNGVHLPAWVAPELQQLWDEAMPGWTTQASDGRIWRGVRKIANTTLWQTHQQLKGRMLDEVYARTGIRLDTDALTVVWARRFASYKRPDLLFSDIERLKKLLFDTERPIQIIVAGKSHPADGQGKQIIAHIEQLANFELKHRAVFVDDYSISLARVLVSGADIWLNTPIFGLEASGTSGMKSAANGVIQCTVPDGWAYEVDWYGLGYTLPVEKAEEEIYSLFEKKIIPAFYKRNAQGVPELWITTMKESIAILSPRFSSQRMVEDYVNKMYMPRLEVISSK